MVVKEHSGSWLFRRRIMQKTFWLKVQASPSISGLSGYFAFLTSLCLCNCCHVRMQTSSLVGINPNSCQGKQLSSFSRHSGSWDALPVFWHSVAMVDLNLLLRGSGSTMLGKEHTDLFWCFLFVQKSTFDPKIEPSDMCSFGPCEILFRGSHFPSHIESKKHLISKRAKAK